MSKATTNLDDVEVPNYNGDGESSIDVRETTPHIEQGDGVSTIDLSDYAGGERITESVENAYGDPAPQTSNPTHAPEPKVFPESDQGSRTQPVQPSTPVPENSVALKDASAPPAEKPAAKRGRPAKTATPAADADKAAAAE
jgi:hypothetical protein